MGNLRPARLIGGLVLAVALLGGAAWSDWYYTRRGRETQELVSRSREVQTSLARLLVRVEDIETGARGFVITGDASFLEPFVASTGDVERQLETVRSLTRGSPTHQARCDALERLIAERTARARASVDLRRNSGFEAARQAVASGAGRAVMDLVRDEIAAMEAEEGTRLTERLAAFNREARASEMVRLASTGVSVVLFITTFALVLRENRLRQRTQLELARTNEELEQRVRERTAELELERAKLFAAFENMDQGVVMTDPQGGNMVFNAAAIRMHGFASPKDVHARIGDYGTDWELRDSAGRVVPFSDWPLPRAIRGDYCKDWEAHLLHLTNGHEWDCSYTCVPVRNAVGDVSLIVLTLVDITDRKRAENEIRTLNAELEQRVQKRTQELVDVNKELESFSYSVSHDLRAPLRHVHGYVEMLQRATGGQLSDQAQRYLNIISDASVEMGQLIDDLLAFSRVGRTEMIASTVRLDAMAQDVISGLEIAARSRSIVWQVAPLPPVVGDPAMVKLVLANLVGNAVKYSRDRDPAHIEIGSAGEEDGRVILFVRDNGAGFDMQYAHKLFGVFQRLHRAEEFEGTGIGLATVRRIVARHGGRVWAEGAVNQGATFYFTLQACPTP